MMFRYFSILILSFCFVSAAVKAEITVWQDDKFGVEIAFPDGWMDQVTKNNSEILKILAPAGENGAHCTLNAEQDERFEIFPAQYLKDIVKRELSEPYWYNYFANHDEVKLNYLAEEGGMGRGFATYVDYNYLARKNNKRYMMRGVAYATIYHDMRVTIACASENHAYGKWYPIFSGIVKSVDFDPEFHGRAWGEYRNFFRDYPIFIPQKNKSVIGY